MAARADRTLHQFLTDLRGEDELRADASQALAAFRPGVPYAPEPAFFRYIVNHVEAPDARPE